MNGPRPVALVTGAAKRIGAAVSHALARAGHDVVVHHRTSAGDAQALVAALEAAGARAWIVQADLEDPTAAEALLEQARRAAGRPVSVLVNNASRFPERRLQDASWDDLDAMVRLHAWAPLALTRALAAQDDLPPGACVVNLLDTRVTSIDPEHVPYLLSKQLLGEVTRLTARLLAPRLRVNAVAPGPILPPSSKEGAEADAELEKGAHAVPLRRAGTPDEVAHAVLALVQNHYVTGQTLFVDGGRHLLG